MQEAAARTGASLALANVFELTPATVPHQWGTTLRYMHLSPAARESAIRLLDAPGTGGDVFGEIVETRPAAGAKH